MIYDSDSMMPLARRAGFKDAEGFSKKFLPFLVFPALLLFYNPVFSLLALLLVLRLPHIYLWYLSKERQKKVRRELPLFISSLQWLMELYPVQEALCSVKLGVVSEIYDGFCEAYSQGESFKDALETCAIFPELEDLNRRLLIIYRTGSGSDLLGLYSDKILSNNLVRLRDSSAKMQLFALAYTTLSSVLPAMYSGMTLYSGEGNGVLYISLALCVALVILWKLVD